MIQWCLGSRRLLGPTQKTRMAVETNVLCRPDLLREGMWALWGLGSAWCQDSIVLPSGSELNTGFVTAARYTMSYCDVVKHLWFLLNLTSKRPPRPLPRLATTQVDGLLWGRQLGSTCAEPEFQMWFGDCFDDNMIWSFTPFVLCVLLTSKFISTSIFHAVIQPPWKLCLFILVAFSGSLSYNEWG